MSRVVDVYVNRVSGDAQAAPLVAATLVALKRPPICAAMLNILSIIIGLGALLLLVPAFLPLLGWANWVIIPIAVIGLALGAMSSSNAGRNLNIVVVVIGALRLMLGGGLF